MFAAEPVPYKETGSFSPIVLDYLEGSPQLSPFYAFQPDLAGITAAITQKKAQTVDRSTLAEVLTGQYAALPAHASVLQNIEALRSDSTFTVCTAHQPNLFTGPLYFIYKILHAIKLAQHLNAAFGELHFVPVFYMGSEDADLEELNHTYVDGKKYEWKTAQTGAVGRMKIDGELTRLVAELRGQLGVTAGGSDFASLLEAYFQEGATIQDATFGLVNALFGHFGLIVLIGDEPRLKAQMRPVFEQDLFDSVPSRLVDATSNSLGALYDTQAYPRAINLFYLSDGTRQRIEMVDGRFQVQNSATVFSREEMRAELQAHPGRFSPNVILRGLFQETILPNVAFIGGGGELAYWLQLKALFDHYAVPFPVLVLRNSFLVVPARWQKNLKKLNLKGAGLFDSEVQVLNDLIEREGRTPKLNGEAEALKDWYGALRQKAAAIDSTLAPHVAALEAHSIKTLQALERKMHRAERRKRSAVQGQIHSIKEGLFPRGSLQERVENVGQFYARWGEAFIDAVLHHSPALEPHFTVLYEQSKP